MDNKQYQQRIMDINLMINIYLTIVIIGSFISILFYLIKKGKERKRSERKRS